MKENYIKRIQKFSEKLSDTILAKYVRKTKTILFLDKGKCL